MKSEEERRRIWTGKERMLRRLRRRETPSSKQMRRERERGTERDFGLSEDGRFLTIFCLG